jgi:hypothetical protein
VPPAGANLIASVAAAPAPAARVAAPVNEIPLAPAATEARRQSIPLSPVDDPPSRRASAPRPPDKRKSAPTPIETTASFDEEEIDGLVNEVEEIETPVAVPLAAAPADEGTWMGSPSEEDEPVFADDSLTYGATVPIEDLLADAPPVKPSTPGSAFEIDRGFDPEWGSGEDPREAPPTPAFDAAATMAQTPIFSSMSLLDDTSESAPARAGADARPDDVVPIMPFPLPSSEREIRNSGDADVLLTDVASDSDLFSDPSLEIAQLADGQIREIIVPVMLGEGASARRFKLAIRLRLDPVE